MARGKRHSVSKHKEAPGLTQHLVINKSMKKKVSEIWYEESAFTAKKNDAIQHRSTIFHELFHANIPDSEKGPDRMWQEGQIVIGAGTETTAWSM